MAISSLQKSCQSICSELNTREMTFLKAGVHYPSLHTNCTLDSTLYLIFLYLELLATVISKIIKCNYKAETHDATNRYDTSPRQVAATNRLV